MKKVKFDGKLSLNKETVSKLNVEQMDVIKGGSDGGAEFTKLTRLFCKSNYTSHCAGCICGGSPF